MLDLALEGLKKFVEEMRAVRPSHLTDLAPLAEAALRSIEARGSEEAERWAKDLAHQVEDLND